MTSSELETLMSSLSFHRFTASYKGTTLGPLASAPKIEPDVETKDVVLYETGDEAIAQFLTKNNLKITIETCNISAAIALVSEFAKGDNLLDQSNAGTLAITAIGDGNGPVFSFNAYIQPGYTTNLSEGEDTPSSVSLTFIAKGEGDSGSGTGTNP